MMWHRTARPVNGQAPDPHLHARMAIANMARAGEGGTEVSLEHRGLDTLPPPVAGRIRLGHSWQVALGWFARFPG
ncbi:hypothetical protein [Nonomuraea dietziae]|uniref:hypothetical protein n=1 Tax=Nonomuraea dietziae TaxID=65515 RepID=UPI003424E1FA